MRTTLSIIEDMMKSKLVADRGFTREDIEDFIKEYQKSVFSVLLDNGYVRISEDLSISLVKLKARRYVLRGNSYTNNRSYKLKVLTSRDIYTKIEATYNSFLED